MEKKKPQIIPYLSFNGHCEEALHTYFDAFDGEMYYISRWTEDTFDKTPLQIGKVMHAEFSLGQTRMAAGDTFDGQDVNTHIKLMIHMENMADAQHAVSLLKDGGEEISPLRPHPAPDDSGCGSVTKDRFGITWIITCPNPDKAL